MTGAGNPSLLAASEPQGDMPEASIQGGEPKSSKRIDVQDHADGDRVEDAERTPSANDPQLEQIAPYDASVSPEERRRMICEAAYYLAQRRGFYGGMELEDWLQAEVEVDSRLASKPR